jgi:hypothetical protein
MTSGALSPLRLEVRAICDLKYVGAASATKILQGLRPPGLKVEHFGNRLQLSVARRQVKENVHADKLAYLLAQGSVSHEHVGRSHLSKFHLWQSQVVDPGHFLSGKFKRPLGQLETSPHSLSPKKILAILHRIFFTPARPVLRGF